MMRPFGFALAAVLLIAAGALPARAQIKMEIVGPGSKLSAIALSPLKNLGGDQQSGASAEFVGLLSRNLELSGYFRIIPAETYIEDPQQSGYQQGRFNFADWSSINADFLVKGAVSAEQGKVILEALLFDVPQQRQLMGKRYSGSRAEVARMARRFADAVLGTVTGVPGPFDSPLAYVSTRGGRFKEIYTMSLDGHDISRITNNPTINLFPSLDRGARHLLYTSFKTGAPALYLADLSTRRERPIGVGSLIGGSLSPDGQWIVGAVERAGVTDLYLLDSEGRTVRQLTRGGSINVTPAVSPDGRTLAFTSDRSGTPQIYTMAMAGGAPRRLTYRSNYNTNPAFSPDGRRIAYQSRNQGGFDIFTVPAGGGEPIRLTENAGSNQSPSWSPDGRYLIFGSTRSGRPRLYLMFADSGKIISAITEVKGDDTSPRWSWWAGP